MKRTIVLGGTGFFGGLVAERIPEAIVASRSRGLDANKAEDLRANLRRGDLVIDAAGPFQTRSAALIDAAIAIGFDLIDLSDSPEYSSMIYDREAAIGSAGIRVLTACSALSTVSAIVAASVDDPRRLSVYLQPASRYTANRGTTSSVLAAFIGEKRSFAFPPPVGKRHGVTVKSVDSATLPRVIRSLRDIEFVVDTGVPGANSLFRFRRTLKLLQPLTIAMSRVIGKRNGILAYEVEGVRDTKHHLFLGPKSYLLAVLPAVIAARGEDRGLIPPTRHVDREELFAAARSEGIEITFDLQ